MPETSDHATANLMAPTFLDQSRDSHLDNLYRAAIGPMQSDYYLPILTRFEAYGRASPSWNWAAFGLTLNWMLLRGLWLPAVLYLAALAALVLALAAGMAVATPPLAESVQWSLWAALLTMVLLVPGFFGNAWMYGVYRKRLAKALAGTASVQDACMLLARQSASRPRLLAIVLLNIVLAVLLAVWLWPSELHMRMWPRVSGDIVSVETPASSPATVPAPSDAASAAAQAPAEPAAASAPALAPELAVSDTTSAAPQAAAGQDAAAGAESAAASVATTSAEVSTPTAGADAGATTTPAAQPTTAPAPASLADVDPQAAGPATRAALQRQAAIAAHARAAHTRTADGPVATASAPQVPPAAAAPTTNTTPQTAERGSYLINVGLFAEQDNALRAHAKLKAAGLPAISESLQMRNGQRTRVRVGPFATRAQADAAAERIRALQLDAIVVRQ